MEDNTGLASALIVSRSTDLRDGLHSLLTVSPLIGTIRQANDGPSALRSIEDNCPGLVLLDFDLPHEDVLSVLGTIKGHCPDTPCLAFTDHADKRDEIRTAGADMVLLKGYPASSLIATIAELLA